MVTVVSAVAIVFLFSRKFWSPVAQLPVNVSESPPANGPQNPSANATSSGISGSTTTSSTQTGSGQSGTGAANWKTYANTRYLYGFKYPPDRIPYLFADKESKIFVPADSESGAVNIAEKQNEIFSGKTAVLTFMVFDKDFPLESWANENYQRFIGDLYVVSKKNITFAGKPAVEFTGPGNDQAIYKLVIAKPGNHFLVFTESAKSRLFDDVLKTFTFNIYQ